MNEAEIGVLWARIETWLKAHSPDLFEALAPGASDAEIRDAEDAFRVSLPEEARISFRIHNGQLPNPPDMRFRCGLFGQRKFYSLAEVVKDWRLMQSLVEEGAFQGVEGQPLGPVRGNWWNGRWIPVSADGLGNCYCIDMDPAPGGTVGQIISFVHDECERTVIAHSFGEWLDDFAYDLETGEYVENAYGHGILPRSDIE